MQVNHSILNQILKKISTIISNPVGITDSTGVILVHTKLHLEGAFINGAEDLLKTETTQTLLIQGDEYLILPVFLNHRLVFGVVMGKEYEDGKNLAETGKLISEICTLMIEMFNSKEYSNFRRQKNRSFLYEWLNDSYRDDRNLFNVMASDLNINYFHGITVAVLRVHRIFFNKELLPKIESILDKHDIMFLNEDLDFILLFDSVKRPEIEMNLNDLMTELNTILGNYVVAIGGRYDDSLDIKKSYNDAQKLLNLYSNVSQGLLFYDDFMIETYLNDAPSNIKLQYIETIFSKCTPEEISDLCDFIFVYLNNDGSINRISSELFIHKNTAQYRINKILNKTGYDIRKMNQSFQLFIAAFWYNNSQELQYIIKNKIISGSRYE